jgi:hypothetical protein
MRQLLHERGLAVQVEMMIVLMLLQLASFVPGGLCWGYMGGFL